MLDLQLTWTWQNALWASHGREGWEACKELLGGDAPPASLTPGRLSWDRLLSPPRFWWGMGLSVSPPRPGIQQQDVKHLIAIENWILSDRVPYNSCWGHLVPFVSGSCFLVCGTKFLGSRHLCLLSFSLSMLSIKNQKVAHCLFTCQTSQNLALVLIFPYVCLRVPPLFPWAGK